MVHTGVGMIRHFQQLFSLMCGILIILQLQGARRVTLNTQEWGNCCSILLCCYIRVRNRLLQGMLLYGGQQGHIEHTRVGILLFNSISILLCCYIRMKNLLLQGMLLYGVTLNTKGWEYYCSIQQLFSSSFLCGMWDTCTCTLGGSTTCSSYSE